MTTEADQPTPLRQRKKDQTTAALVREAMRLFSTNGYEETSVDEIAEAAHISRRTLFRYFPGKADIVMAWAHGLTTVLAEGMARAPIDIPLQEAVIEALVLVVGHISDDRAEACALAGLIERTPALKDMSLRKYSEWEDALSKGLLMRLPPTEMPSLVSRLLARTAIATFRTVLEEWIGVDGMMDLETLLRRAFRFQPLLWQNDFPLSSG